MRARGFTLIEIVIATVLFAALMGMYYEVFIHVVQLEEYARSSRSFSSVGPAVLDLLEDDLQSLYTHPRAGDAFPLRGTDESMASEPADRLDFVARRRSIHQEEFFGDGNWVKSPINEVGFRLGRGLPGTNTRRLYRREGYFVDGSPLQDGEYFEVYDRVVAFNLEYVGFQVEEEERTDQDSVGDHAFETFESWDSEERRGIPSAVILTLTIEAPKLSPGEEGRRVEKRERRTFVRIIQLVQADDVNPPAATEGQATPDTSSSGSGSTGR